MLNFNCKKNNEKNTQKTHKNTKYTIKKINNYYNLLNKWKLIIKKQF